MPFVTQVVCFKSKTVLATFFHDSNRYYLLDRRYPLPLRTKIVWCEACNAFTETEDLYSLKEIKAKIADLDQRRDEWESIDAQHRGVYKLTARELPTQFKQHEIHQLWSLALEWRVVRQSGGRCLKCKSTAGHVPLPAGKTIKHPAKESQWITCTICHASVVGEPPIELFDANGFHIANDDSL